jgi:FKBP-type peptidyl-prolyl cis-trans isomerase 2
MIVKCPLCWKIYRQKCIDSTEGREPLQFELGAGQLIAGFEAAVLR